MPARQLTLQDILDDHPERKPAGDGWLIRCPAHDDHNPSLKLAEGDGGRLLVHCMAGCDPADVLAALGIGGGGAVARSNGNGHSGPLAGGSAARAGHESSEPVKDPKWHWSTLAIAEAAFGRLAPVKDDPAARDFLNKYGLDPDHLPADDWRVFDHPALGPGIVYRGFDAKGNPVFKFKGFRRNDKGKRSCVFLFGAGGALVFPGSESAALVLVGGEEKGAVAPLAGFRALAFLTGERCPDEEWLRLIVEQAPPRIILANDADEAGHKANLDTARALERAGFPADRISIVAWPDDAPGGYDLNDLLKAGGIDAVRLALESARPFESTLPRCLPAADFITIQRPPLVFHIEGLLPYGSKLTFSATSKFGKSMWAIQTGFALAAGDCEWLGWKFGPPARVLYLQAEIMDALLEARLRWILETMPPELNRERAARNFIIQEIAKGRPNLTAPEGRAMVEALLAIHKPDVLILDPLAALHPGLEENAAESMGLALDYLGGLTLRFGCAVILVHHHSKAGAARGSSVFEAWPESDLQASFLSEDDRSIAKVLMRLRCAYNPGPLYLRMPTPESPWFERMPEGWEPERPGRKPSYSPAVVAVALQAGGNMRWAELKKAVIEATGCSDRTAETLVSDATKTELIRKDAGIYSVVKKGRP